MEEVGVIKLVIFCGRHECMTLSIELDIYNSL